MKKIVFIALALVIGIALAFPKPSYSHGPEWVIGAAAALVGVSLLSAAWPRYGYYGPPSAYAYPPPAYAYPSGLWVSVSLLRTAVLSPLRVPWLLWTPILWLLRTSVVSKSLYAATIELHFEQVVVVTDKGCGWSAREGRIDTRFFWGCVANREVER